MINTVEGIRLEFIRLDQWVIKMLVVVGKGKNIRILATAVFTIGDLEQEISTLKLTKPIEHYAGDNHGRDGQDNTEQLEAF